MPPDRETFTLTLEALPREGDVPAIIRLRAFLKDALRRWRFRCLKAEQSKDGDHVVVTTGEEQGHA